MSEEGDVVDVMPVILRQIRDEIRGMRADTNMRLDDTNRRLDDANVRMTKGFAELGQRLDRVFIGPLGSTVRDLSERVAAIEARLDERRDG